MENNNSYEKFLASVKHKLSKSQVLVECSANFDNDEVLAKVLGVDASASVMQVESLVGEASVSGVITINLIYLTETEQVGSQMYTTNFSSKIIDQTITPESKVIVTAKMDDAIVNSLSSQSVKVTCNVILDGECNKNEEIHYLTAVSDGIFTKQVETTAMYLADCKTTTWTENYECKLTEPIRKLLSSTYQVICKQWEADYNILTVEGQIFNKLIYLTDEETPTMKTVYNSYDFKQDIELENISKDSFAQISVDITAQDAKTTVDEKNGQTTIDLQLPVKAEVCVYENKTFMTISDLFSTQNNVLITNAGYNNCISKQPIYIEKKIEGNVSLTDSEPRIDKLLAVPYSHIKVVSSYINDDKIIVEGIACANLIYLNDEESRVFSVDIEIPFVINDTVELSSNSMIDVFAVLCDVDVMVKKGRDVYLDGNVKVFANVSECESGGVISEIEIGEKLEDKDAGIEIYFAKAGDSVWDIAKQLKVNPELVEKQNEEIVFPLEKDENIAMYYN